MMLLALLQAAAEKVVAPAATGLTTDLIWAVAGAAGVVIGAIGGAAVKIIDSIKQTRAKVVAGQEQIVTEQRASRNRAIKRDRNINKIHGLVNSRLAIALRLVVAAAKEKAERTNTPTDLAAYQQAIEKLAEVEREDALEDPEEPWDGSDRREVPRGQS